MLETVLSRGIADTVLCGGVVGNIMLAAQGHDLGAASMEFLRAKGLTQFIADGRRALDSYADRIVLPIDLACVTAGGRKEVPLDAVADDESYVDIGALTIDVYKRQAWSSWVATTPSSSAPSGCRESPTPKPCGAC